MKVPEYYEKSLSIKNINQQDMGLSYVDFAESHVELANFPEVSHYATLGLMVVQALPSKRLQKKALLHLPVMHAAWGDADKALHYHKPYQLFNYSLQSGVLCEQIPEKQARYQAEQQAIEPETQPGSLEQQHTLILGLAAFFLIGGLIMYLLFNRYKLQQKNLKLSLENEQYRLSSNLQLRREIDETIYYFATSLYGKNTIDEILWDVAKNCIAKMGFVDCVIYLLDEEQKVLVQKAAFGTKNPEAYTILSPIVIPLGKGIVGSVATSGKAEIVPDTTQDPRYLVDDQIRYSELTVPLILQDKVIGIIDSEHPEKNFFNDHHLEALQTIAAICSSKIARAQADEEVKKAKLLQLEADHIKKLDLIKSRFFANISHEFRTPLHLILAPLHKTQESITMEEIDMMKRNANRLLRLVSQLLDLAKAEIGMLTLDLKQGNVIQFLHHLAHSFRSLAENKSIDYQIDIPSQELIAPFDGDKLEKIAYNLLSNAIKFTPSGGKVTIRVEIEADCMLNIIVADTGIGIPEHLQSRIFDRFYQIDSSQTRVFQGTGIGLSLTKELVVLCKGSIMLHSIDGKGSSFIVRLPLMDQVAEDAKLPYAETVTNLSFTMNEPGMEAEHLTPRGVTDEKDTETIHEGKPTILLVEDHAELRDYVRKQLTDHFQVELATQGNEGLSMAKKIIPDLVITDIMMPVMDGVTLIRHLKADDLTSHIPVIMLTAKDDAASKKEGFEGGAAQYLVKPFAIDELLARIKSLLTQRDLLRKKYSREVILQPTSTTIPDREARFLEKAIQIIDEHIMDENFTVETFQKEIGMSRTQFHRKLKALTDQSASDFIRFIRLKRAADLLQQPGMQIAEAALLSGFSHMSYFSKCFKEQFGMPPSEFVKQH